MGRRGKAFGGARCERSARVLMQQDRGWDWGSGHFIGLAVVAGLLRPRCPIDHPGECWTAGRRAAAPGARRGGKRGVATAGGVVF